jgi:tetrahydromethanopterin S-methyltransferase subunit B
MEVLIKINDNRFNEFKNYLQKVDAEIINSFPEEIIVRSVDEVKERIEEAENDEFISEEEERQLFIELYQKYSL